MENKKRLGIGLGIFALITAVVAAITKAAPVVVICTPGDEKCIGPDWCRCNPEGTKWDVVTPNATECAVLPQTATLYGTVTDIDTRAPIGSINVNCNGYTDTTTPDGTHRIENIPPGEYSVVFTDPLGRYETKEMSKVLVAGLNKLDASLVPIEVLYNVGIGIYDETVPKYVAGTIVLDGVSHPTKYNSYFWWESKVESGTHTLDLVVLPTDYQFVRWDIFNFDTSELIQQTTERPLTLDINMNTFIQAVVTPALAGILERDPFGFIWYEGLAGWEWVHTGREIPLNKEISLAPGWVNQSEVYIVGHVDLVITYPDGTTVTLSAAPDSAQDKEAAPGGGYHVGFEPFTTSRAGTYTITATLSSAGQVLDSVTFTLEAIGVAPSYEVIEPVLLKSLDYPPDCSLDIVGANFSVDPLTCLSHRELKICYYPFFFDCQVNYSLPAAGSVNGILMAVKEEDYNAWLNGLTLGGGHCRQSWDPDPYIPYYTGAQDDEDISHGGSCRLSDTGIVLDRNVLKSGPIWIFYAHDYLMTPGSYRVLLWFNLSCNRLREGRIVTDRAYGARIYEVGNVTIP